MSDDTDKRLTTVELRLDGIERDMGKVVTGLDKLLSAQAAAPSMLTWKMVGGTLTSVAAAGYVVWRIIEMSPAVSVLTDKLTETRYRIERLEAEQKRTTEALGWRPTIAKAN
jgi:hypothetical protein